MNDISRVLYINKNWNFNPECDFATPIQNQLGFLLGLNFSRSVIYFTISVLLEEP